jgi:hypothetical protein
MRAISIGAVLGALAITLAAPALGGEQEDPSLGDTFSGKEGGVSYYRDEASFNPVSHYISVEAGCDTQDFKLIGGGAASAAAFSTTYLASGRGIDYADNDTKQDDGWFASGYGDSNFLASYSICRKGGGLKYVRKEIKDGASPIRGGKVSCGGKKWHVTAGAAFISPSESWTNSSWPYDSNDRGSEPDDGWRAKVYDTAGGPGGFSMYAICSKEDKLRYRDASSAPFAAGGAAMVPADCRGEEQVVGGGALVSGSTGEAHLIESAPFDRGDEGFVPDDRWRTTAYNRSGEAKTLRTFAICRR